MDLITRSDDERLEYTDKMIFSFEMGDQDELVTTYRNSLRAALTRCEAAEAKPRIRPEGCQHPKARMIEWINEGACPVCLTAASGINKERAEKAEAALCRMKEVLAEARIALWDAHPKIPLEREIDGKIREVLSSSSPCRHEAIVKRVEDTEGMQKALLMAMRPNHGIISAEEAAHAVRAWLRGEG